jgi:hypothetical protein
VVEEAKGWEQAATQALPGNEERMMTIDEIAKQVADMLAAHCPTTEDEMAVLKATMALRAEDLQMEYGERDETLGGQMAQVFESAIACLDGEVQAESEEEPGELRQYVVIDDANNEVTVEADLVDWTQGGALVFKKEKQPVAVFDCGQWKRWRVGEVVNAD